MTGVARDLRASLETVLYQVRACQAACRLKAVAASPVYAQLLDILGPRPCIPAWQAGDTCRHQSPAYLRWLLAASWCSWFLLVVNRQAGSVFATQCLPRTQFDRHMMRSATCLYSSTPWTPLTGVFVLQYSVDATFWGHDHIYGD